MGRSMIAHTCAEARLITSSSKHGPKVRGIGGESGTKRQVSSDSGANWLPLKISRVDKNSLGTQLSYTTTDSMFPPLCGPCTHAAAEQFAEPTTAAQPFSPSKKANLA